MSVWRDREECRCSRINLRLRLFSNRRTHISDCPWTHHQTAKYIVLRIWPFPSQTVSVLSHRCRSCTQLGSAVSSGDRGSTRARTQVETPPESLYSCRAGQSQHWWIVLEAASYMFPAGHRVPGDTTFSANNHINKHELFFTLLVRKDKWNPPRFKIKAEKWNSLGGGSVSVCAAVCHRHSVRTHLGVITTRQQHVNKEDDWSACAFVFHANQPADAAALRFVPRKQTEQHHCQHHARSWHLSSNQYYCLLSSASAHLLKVALRAGAGPTVRKPHRIRKSKVGVGLTGSRDRWEDVGHWSHDSQTSLLMSPHIKLLPHGPSLDQHQQI